MSTATYCHASATAENIGGERGFGGAAPLGAAAPPRGTPPRASTATTAKELPKKKFATKQARNRERSRREQVRRQISAAHLAALQEGQRRGHERRAAELAAMEAERAALRERIRKPLDDTHPDILRCREERAKRTARLASVLDECRALLQAGEEAAKRAHRGGRPKKVTHG